MDVPLSKMKKELLNPTAYIRENLAQGSILIKRDYLPYT